MSFESTQNFQNIPTPSPEDIQAALELIEEDQELRSHPRVTALIESDFVTENGRQLDPGNFLAAVKEALAKERPSEETGSYQERIDRVMSAMVVHSKTWEAERKLD